LEKSEKFSWEVFPHPPYSPDLPLLTTTGWVLIRSHEGPALWKQWTVCAWLQNTKIDFNHCGTFKLMQHSQKCLDHSGDFMEEWWDIPSNLRWYLFLYMYISFNIK
jgi:hypothetical protein